MSELDASEVDPEQPALAEQPSHEDRAAIQAALLDLRDKLVTGEEALDVVEQAIADLAETVAGSDEALGKAAGV